jgi:hypothetical protein
MKRPSKKLDQQFYGPYLVVLRIGTQAYCLKLLQQAGSNHDIFYISLLQLYVSNRCTVLELRLPIEIDNEEQYELKEILQSKYKYGTLCYCVKYKR